MANDADCLANILNRFDPEQVNKHTMPPTPGGGEERQQFRTNWTPLNDLSSESEFDEEEEEEEETQVVCTNGSTKHDCEVFEDSIANIDVEDFVNGRLYRNSDHRLSAVLVAKCRRKQTPPAPPEPVPAISTRPLSTKHLPNEPCFTLSNQLKTLIFNSNRIRNQNYFFN